MLPFNVAAAAAGSKATTWLLPARPLIRSALLMGDGPTSRLACACSPQSISRLFRRDSGLAVASPGRQPSSPRELNASPDSRGFLHTPEGVRLSIPRWRAVSSTVLGSPAKSSVARHSLLPSSLPSRYAACCPNGSGTTSRSRCEAPLMLDRRRWSNLAARSLFVFDPFTFV